MANLWISLGAALAGLSVAGGAFASHALRDRLSERSLEIFETGAKYQMYHALALILVAIILLRAEQPSVWLNVSGWAFVVGIAIFSGSLYGLSLSGIKWLGAITPIGGVAFLLGWGSLAIAAWGIK